VALTLKKISTKIISNVVLCVNHPQHLLFLVALSKCDITTGNYVFGFSAGVAKKGARGSTHLTTYIGDRDRGCPGMEDDGWREVEVGN
jgi:hypothetical protein